MIRSLTILLAATGLAIPTDVRAQDIAEARIGMTSRQLCDNLQQVALRKVRPMLPAGDRTGLHARMQDKLPKPPQTASVVLSLLVGGGMGASGPAGLESIVAWRDANGRWFAQRAEEARAGMYDGPEVPLAPIWPDPSPKSLLRGHLPEPGGLRYSSGQLSASDGAQLDRALNADSCIGVEPPTLPSSIPLRSGGTVPCVPDSAWRHLEVRRGEVVQRYSRACYAIGPVGAIGALLDGVGLPGSPVYRNRADLYNGTESPLAPSLRAFLSAKLPETRLRDSRGEHEIVGVRHSAPCEMVLTLGPSAGRDREITVSLKGEDRSYGRWIENGVVPIGPIGADPSFVAPDTILGLQLQGALFHLPHLCEVQP